jgi:ubiquinol-cytochrome c reductase subunit 6
MKSQQCAPLKHHYDECAERVMQQQEENGKADEDCVEECMLRLSSRRC